MNNTCWYMLFCFWLCHTVYGILVPGSGIEPVLPTLEAWNVNHWTARAEKAMAPNSSTLAWKIPCTEEAGRLQSMGSLRVGYDWATSLSKLSCIGEGNGNPLQCSCLENPRDGGAWWAAVYGVAQSRTRLKRLRWRRGGGLPGKSLYFSS